MNFPAELKYNAAHLWVKVEGNTAYVGITDYAQDQLGEVLYVDLPEVGAEFAKGKQFSEVESGKNTSALLLPFAGRVLEVNEALDDEPDNINKAPYEAWIAKFEILDPAGLDELISAEAYQETLK